MHRSGFTLLLTASVIAACQTSEVASILPGRLPTESGRPTPQSTTRVSPTMPPGNVFSPTPNALDTTNARDAASNFVPPPNSAAIMGKLKSGPASVIASTGSAAEEALDLLTRTFSLAALEEEPVAAAEVRLVDIHGTALTSQVAKTDAQGGFLLYRPPGLEEALVQALFVAGTTTVEYLAVAPADGTLEIDTATTLATARWREARKQGARPTPPALPLLAELRKVLDPSRLPFMGRGSRDVADAFDQFVLDQPRLREKLAVELPDLLSPLQKWESTPWHTEASLRKQGAIGEKPVAPVGRPHYFAVDATGTLYLVNATANNGATVHTVDRAGGVKKLLPLPATTRAPYAITLSPNQTLHIVCQNVAGGWLTFRWDNETWTPLFSSKLSLPRFTANASPAVAANNEGDVFIASPTQHLILVARAQANTTQILAGAAGQAGFADGDGASARFNQPRALTLDAQGHLLVADGGNGAIRRVSPSGRVKTIAGQPHPSRRDGPELRLGRRQMAHLGQPNGLVVTPDGTLFTSDLDGNRILRISPQGSVFLVAVGHQPKPGLNGKREILFERPGQLAIDGEGTLYIQDIGRDGTFRLQKLIPGPGNYQAPPPKRPPEQRKIVVSGKPPRVR